MFIDDLDRQEHERSVLAMRHPEAYNALVEQEQEHRQADTQGQDVPVSCSEKIK